MKIDVFDDRRSIITPGNKEETIAFCVEDFIDVANESIEDHQYFAVALSGGSTPHSIFQALVLPENRDRIDWTKVLVFWGDERSVPPTNPDSNYKMAMDSGFASLPIPPKQIFRMVGEGDIEENAKKYEELVRKHLHDGVFDLVMLGMGEDGHTASLFPKTHALHTEDRLVVGNYVPRLDTWRMSLTFDCINQARHIVIYVIGKSKAGMIKKIFNDPYNPDELPIQKIGTAAHNALWILDQDAASELS
jgi:6-phosphogluconolactonase